MWVNQLTSHTEGEEHMKVCHDEQMYEIHVNNSIVISLDSKTVSDTHDTERRRDRSGADNCTINVYKSCTRQVLESRGREREQLELIKKVCLKNK